MTERIKLLQNQVISFYVNDKKSTADIALLLKINLKTVFKILKSNDIKIRKGKINLIGNSYGRLTVLKFTTNDNSQKAMWECLCQCGNKTETRGADLISSKVKSCGCFHSEVSRENIKQSHKNYPKSFGFKGIGELTGGYLSCVKNSAMKRNFEYSVSKEYLWDLYLKQNRKCALSDLDICFGISTDKKRFGKREQTASLDRIDSSKGYIENNVWWVHKDINNIKQDFTVSELLNYCKLIYEKHFK